MDTFSQKSRKICMDAINGGYPIYLPKNVSDFAYSV